MRLVLAMVVVVAACGDDGEMPDLGPHPARHVAVAPSHPDGLNPRMLRRFRPIVRVEPPSKALVALGRMLFFDARLSRDGTTSCNSCHPLATYGADHRATSPRSNRNAPSVFNAAGQIAQFWDGRAADVETQATVPMLNPSEMGMTAEGVVRQISGIPGYVASFAAAFPENDHAVTLENVAYAIGAFERTLVTPSRWDRFLGGDANALTHTEKEGLRLFSDLGCVQCHTGELVGGSMFQRVGAIVPWPDQRDQGRFEITHQEADRMSFKVPSLRNVAETAPYFHDGSVDSLGDAVWTMAHYQLGEDLDEAEIASIVAWLETLTGEAITDVPPLPRGKT